MDPIVIAALAFFVIIILLRVFMKIAGFFVKAGILILVIVLVWRLLLSA